MRFLLGLLLGAAVVLGSAEGISRNTNWQARLSALSGYVQHRLAAIPPAGPPAGERENPAPPAPAEAPEPANQPIQRPPDPHLQEVQTMAATGRPSATPADRAPESTGAPPAVAERAADPDPGSQPVWVPFHSEMSASGFADRLSEQLDHPFRVERRGPGRYQVVFAYADEPQRRMLLDRAAEATGLPL